MGLKSDLETYVQSVHDAAWNTRQGQQVPEPEEIALRNQAVKLEATVLYADLGRSTRMVRNHSDWFSAEMYKTFLYCAARVIRSNSGSITAYDGDRVMAVFIGGSKNTNAARAALRLNYTVTKILQPKIDANYPRSNFELQHRVGIDTSELFVARTGIRGNNDLVWVGNAANNAAKMAALPTTYKTYISADVYQSMSSDVTYGGDPSRNMWTNLGTADLGYRIYGSTYWWSFS